jgi:uncharacterized membrane protein YkvI
VARKKIPSIYMEVFTIVLGMTIIGFGIWWLVVSLIPIFGCIFMIVIGALYILGGGSHFIRRRSRNQHMQPLEKSSSIE